MGPFDLSRLLLEFFSVGQKLSSTEDKIPNDPYL